MARKGFLLFTLLSIYAFIIIIAKMCRSRTLV